MKLKIPAEAAALGVILFSANMREAMVAGILLLFVTVLAEVLKGFLKDAVPDWSWKASVCIAATAFYAAAMRISFGILEMEMTTGLWIMTGIVGLLVGYHVITRELEADYGTLEFEGALLWGFWILAGIAREFLAGGSIYGAKIAEISFKSGAFQKPMFGFLAAGLVLAGVCAVTKKDCADTKPLLVAVPAVFFLQPFAFNGITGVLGIVLAGAVALVLYLSTQRTLVFSNVSRSYRKLPVEMLAMGIIYMILSVY